MEEMLFQENQEEFHAGFFRKNVFKQEKAQIKVLETAIAGMHFHVENEEEEKNLEKLVPGTELKLYREPDNAYDEWAIGVYYGEDDLVGYISRYKNETIARLMDCGKKFTAVVDEPRVADKQTKQGQAPTERGGIPISVYLEET